MEAIKSVQVALDDEVKITEHQRNTVIIKWKSGVTTEVARGVNCNHCQKEVASTDIPKLEGLCRSCYPEQKLKIPAMIIDGANYIWEYPVSQTSYIKEGSSLWRHTTHHADRYGHNFGVGDTVQHDPNWYRYESRADIEPIEGVVTQLHQYTTPHLDERIYGAQIMVDMKDLLPFTAFYASTRLEALTNSHVKFEGIDRIPRMFNVPFKNFDQITDELKRVLDDPIARAIWMGYNRAHLMSKEDRDLLRKKSLKLSQELKDHPLSRDRLALWFMKKIGFKIDEGLAVFMVPYLNGELQATYKPAA